MTRRKILAHVLDIRGFRGLTIAMYLISTKDTVANLDDVRSDPKAHFFCVTIAHNVYLSIEIAIRVNTDTATDKYAMKLLMVQYTEPNTQSLEGIEHIKSYQCFLSY